MKGITKMREIENSTKGNQIKLEKTRFEIVNPENDVIHELLIMTLNKSFEIQISRKIGDFGKFGNIGTFGYTGTQSILAKNREIF
jgi:hypothetical protein